MLSERLLKSLSTDLQRAWLRRLAAITFPFRRSLALDIARLSPSVAVSDVDWNYLASQVLDQSGPDEYTVPLLLRPLLKSDTQQPSEKTILIASARHVFRNAGTVGTMLAEMGEHQLTIRDYLRHSNLHVTNKYLQATSRTKRVAHGKLVDAFLPAGLLPRPTPVH